MEQLITAGVNPKTALWTIGRKVYDLDENGERIKLMYLRIP